MSKQFLARIVTNTIIYLLLLYAVLDRRHDVIILVIPVVINCQQMYFKKRK